MKGVSCVWYLKRMELDTRIKPFESEDEDLNIFLINDAKNYLKQRLSVSYLIENETETIAYFCLSNDIWKTYLANSSRNVFGTNTTVRMPFSHCRCISKRCTILSKA